MSFCHCCIPNAQNDPITQSELDKYWDEPRELDVASSGYKFNNCNEEIENSSLNQAAAVWGSACTHESKSLFLRLPE